MVLFQNYHDAVGKIAKKGEENFIELMNLQHSPFRPKPLTSLQQGVLPCLTKCLYHLCCFMPLSTIFSFVAVASLFIFDPRNQDPAVGSVMEVVLADVGAVINCLILIILPRQCFITIILIFKL